MASKYAIALRELVQLHANLDKKVKVFPIERFRDLLGVPPGKRPIRKVIEPALLQVNALLQSRRANRAPPTALAPVHEVAISRWRKEGGAYRAAMQERNRPKVGRMARSRAKLRSFISPSFGIMLSRFAQLEQNRRTPNN